MDDELNFNDAITRLESGVYQPLGADDEGNWNKIWTSQVETCGNSLAMAMVGGALADRLAWVFHAGYQGMMRYAFPFCPKQGWASYLVAEDKTGEYPGTSLKRIDGGVILSGYKSWVAGSEHVNHLVVQVSGSEDNTLLLVGREDDGLSLTSRDKPGFLTELSQGFAAFEDVFVDERLVFGSKVLPSNFAQSEPLHVLTALNAFIISQTLSAGGDSALVSAAKRSLDKTGELVASEAVDDEFFLAIARFDEETTETAHGFEAFIEKRNTDLYAAWQKDRGLVNMFSRGLQKRARWLRDK